MPNLLKGLLYALVVTLLTVLFPLQSFATIVPPGQIIMDDFSVTDWSTPVPVTTTFDDPLGDISGTGEYDLKKIWLANDATNLYVRWDIQLQGNSNMIKQAAYALVLDKNNNGIRDTGDIYTWLEFDAQGDPMVLLETMTGPNSSSETIIPGIMGQQIVSGAMGSLASAEAAFPLNLLGINPAVVILWAESHPSASFNSVIKDKAPDSGFIVYNIVTGALNHPPVYTSDTFNTSQTIYQGQGLHALSATDPDGDLLFYTLTSGSLPPGITLFPNGTFSGTTAAPGTYTVTVSVNDGNLGTAATTLVITVLPNPAPVANNDSYSVAEDTPLTIPSPGVLQNDTDSNGDTLSASLLNGPAHGTLTLNTDGSFTYTPSANYNGSDSFTYRAFDDYQYSNIATVNITVTPVNDGPAAADDTYSTSEDNQLTVQAPGLLVNDSDIDGNPLTVTGPASLPGHGILSALNPNGAFIYTPNPNYAGQDSFTYTITDGQGGFATAAVTINITAVNDAPAYDDSVATNTSQTIPEGSGLAALVATDIEGSTLTYTLVSGALPAGITLNSDGTFSGTASYTSAGSYSVTIQVSDGSGGTDTVNLTVTVTNVNWTPAAADDTYSTNEDTPLTVAAPGVLVNDTDADGESLSTVLVNGPAHGTLTINPDGSFTYTPEANYNGPDSFTYQASDGTESSNTATVNITVNSVNDAPAYDDSVATNTSQTIPEGSGLAALVATDIEGSTLTYTLVSGALPAGITLNSDGTFSGTASYTSAGSYSVTIQVSDGSGGTDTVNLTITVTNVNRTPAAADDTYSTNEDTPLTVAASGVLVNDTDADGESLSTVLVNGPAHGTLTLNPDGSFTYTPEADYNGPDSFTYQANDGTESSNTATVNITVNSVNDAPAYDDSVATNTSQTIPEGSGLAALVATDIEGSTLTYTLVSGALPAGITLNSDGTFSGTASYTSAGSYSVTIQVSDGSGGTDTVNLTITVTEKNDGQDNPSTCWINTDNIDKYEVSGTASATDGTKVNIYVFKVYKTPGMAVITKEGKVKFITEECSYLYQGQAVLKKGTWIYEFPEALNGGKYSIRISMKTADGCCVTKCAVFQTPS